MPKLISVVPFVLAASLAAQNCIDRDYGVPLGGGDEVMFAIQPIGFAFPFAGTSYSNVHICTNGYFHLSNGGVPPPAVADGQSTAAELVGGPPRVCPLWTDINMVVANGASVYINATPAKCTITWSRAVGYGTTLQFDVQAQLFPNGEILFVYGAGASNSSTFGPTWHAAITGVSPGQGAVLPAASDLILGGATIDNTLYEEWLAQGTFDLANNSLRLVPAAPGWGYTMQGAPANCAATTNYGIGCIDVSDTFYEYMAAGTFDLAGTTLTMLRQGNGYIVLNTLPGTLVTPTPAAAIIANGDDTEQIVTLSAAMPVAGGSTNALTVCSNGRIALSSTGNGNAWTPVVNTFLGWSSTTIAADWHDYSPQLAGSGKIKFEEIAGTAYVTWDGVYSYQTTSPSRFQYQFHLATGDCTIVYDTFGTGGLWAHLVGYSVGGPSPNPQVLDISALAAPVNVYDTVAVGLRLATVGYPSLGSTAFSYDISEVPNVLPLAFLFFGDTQINPGIDLTFLGMPGCFAYTSANLISLGVPIAGGTGSLALPIPNNAALAGVSLASQAIAFSLFTPANLISSNGNLATIGY